jgi:hemoglobin
MNQGQTLYEVLGEDRIKILVHLFYLEVKNNPDLRRLYPEDLAPAEERLFLFLIHVFGGPHTYLEKRGHPMLRKRHFQWEIDQNLRNTWLSCMQKAMESLDLEKELMEHISTYFIKVADHMVNK